MNRQGKLALLAAAVLLLLAYPQQTASAQASWYQGRQEAFDGFTAVSGNGYGYVPSGRGASFRAGQEGAKRLLGRAALPAAYMNDLDTLTATYPGTKDQGNYDTCWAFSAAALAEFDLITDDKTADKSKEFSILQMAYFTYNHVEDPLEGTYGDTAELNGRNYKTIGGNLDFATRSLLQWKGPVEESKFPYSAVDQTSSIDSSYAYAGTEAHLQNVYLLDLHNDAAGVKRQIMEHGSVGAGYYAPATESERQAFTGYDKPYGRWAVDTYCCSDATKIPNHAINIVGWDDAFPAENFADSPAGDGAWLIRNSWSDTTDFDEASYFWISYFDATLEDTVWALDFEPADNYDYNYQYDGGIVVYDAYHFDTVANVFSVKGEANESLEAVSFSMMDHADVSYTVRVYTNLTDRTKPTSGCLAATVKGKTGYAGVYTIPLDSAVPLAKGTNFSVVVETEEEQGVDVEYAMSGAWKGMLKTKVYIEPGQSFVRYRTDKGDAGTWYDMEALGNGKTGNVCIKAYTSSLEGKKVAQVKGLKKKSAGKKSIILQWSRVSGADGYEIYRAASKDGTYKKIGTVASGSKTSYKNTGLERNKTYYYRVRAYRKNEIEVTETVTNGEGVAETVTTTKTTTTVGKFSKRAAIRTAK